MYTVFNGRPAGRLFFANGKIVKYMGSLRKSVRMVSSAENRVDWFRTILEILRHAIFVGFYVLSLRMVFVTLTHTAPVVSMVVGAAAVTIAILAFWKIEWALFSFVILIPVVSGFQAIGFMKGLPLLSVGFASIFLVWLPKRLVWYKKGTVPGSGIGNLVDVLSGIVLLSLIMLLIPYPVDFVFSRVWSFPFVGQDQPLYCIDGSYVLLQGLLFYRVLELEIRAERMWRWVLPVLYVQASLIMGFSLFQWIYGVPHMYFRGRFGITSPFDDIHSYGSYVLVLFFVFLCLSLREGKVQKLVNGLFAGIIFVLLIWAGSNGTLMAMFAVGVLFLANTLRKRHFIVIVSCLAIGAVSIIVFPSIVTKSGLPVVQRYGRSLDLLDIRNVSKVFSARSLLWDRAAGIMKEFPVTGAGIGTFYKISPLYHDLEVKEWKRRAKWRENTHNYYLQLGSELGIPALLIFLGIIFYTYRAGFEVLRQKEASGYIIKGLLFGLGGYLITMVTSHPLLLSNQQFLFWFLFGVISVAQRTVSSQQGGKTAG